MRLVSLISIVHSAAAVRYFMYKPSDFNLYATCNLTRNAPYGERAGQYGVSWKHSVDVLFFRDLMDANWTGAVRVSPSEAEIFVVPVLCSQAANGFCGGIGAWENGVKDMISKLTYLKTGVRDHLLVCDDFESCMARGWGSEFIVGCFEPLESWRHQISVGYSTYSAKRQIDGNNRLSQAIRWHGERKYNLLFTGKNDGRGAYSFRALLSNDIRNKTVRKDFFLFRDTTREEMQSLMHNTNVILTLPGDTATTDRIFNAFETGTLVAALTGGEKERLLNALPFHFAVAWEELFIWIDMDEYVKQPLQALYDAIDTLDAREILRKRRLMRLWQKEVTWTHEFSRASQNVLEAAVRKKRSEGF